MTDETNPPPPRGGGEPKAVSAQLRNRAARVVEAVQARRDQKQTLAWSPRDFVLCGLPFKKPSVDRYVRHNGTLKLEVVGSEFGLPYGQDRLLPIWLATAFKVCGQPVDNVVRFRCAGDILRAFGLPTDGAQHALLRQRLQRVFGATYLVWKEGEKKRLVADSYRLIRRVSLWFEQDIPTNQYTLWQNVIQLDEGFANDLRSFAIPVDLQSVRALRANPGALDLYIWQAHRSWELATRGIREVKMHVFGPTGVLAQFGSTVSNERKARQSMRGWQKDVMDVWPECPNRLSLDGNYLLVRPARPIGDAKIMLPGVSPTPPVPLRPLPEGRDDVTRPKKPLMLVARQTPPASTDAVDAPPEDQLPLWTPPPEE